MEEKINIALDGYSACGKSTLAKDIAKKIGYRHIDSGSMYRAVTWHFLQLGVDILDNEAVAGALQSLQLSMHLGKEGVTDLFLNGHKMTSELRTVEVNEYVSEVSSLGSVRSFLVKKQQSIGAAKGIVMDGRDIGSVVFPDAIVKIFLTATLPRRVERRLKELQNKGVFTTEEDVRKNLIHRDMTDSNRAISPLIQTSDAVLMDNTNLSRNEQLEMLLALIKARVPVHTS